PEAAGKDAERFRVLHEHRLADEEIPELHAQVDVIVEVLLEGKLDVAADREAARLLGAPVGRLHDSRAAAGDDREALLDEAAGNAAGEPILRVAAPGARRSEDAHRGADVGQRVESLDEFAKDAQGAPGIGLQELRGLTTLLEKALVLGRPLGAAAHHHRAAAAGGVACGHLFDTSLP